MVLLDRVYNCSVSTCDDGYLLYLECKLQFFIRYRPLIYEPTHAHTISHKIVLKHFKTLRHISILSDHH